MKNLFLIVLTFILVSCARQTVNVYTPQPANTVIVKDEGDAGINVSYFGNGEKHAAEKNLISKGIALQSRVVVYNKFFIEGSFSSLNERSDGEIFESSSNQRTFRSTAKYNNKEIGIGKIVKINNSGSSNFLFSAGYGFTNYRNQFEIINNNSIKYPTFNFENNHIYFGFLYQLNTGIFTYQVGFKHSQINFKNITTNNETYFVEDIKELKNYTQGFKGTTQFFNDFGISPFKESKWLSIHAGFSFSNRINVESRFKSRVIGGNLSLMASPQGLLKRRKVG